MDRRRFLGAVGAALASSAAFALEQPGPARSAARGTGASGMTAAEFHAARRYVATPFGDIAYVERGSGDAALFLHGFPLNGFQWRDALVRLAPYRRCLAPDFLAMGYTRVAEGAGVDPDAQMRMLLAFLDKLSIERADVIANDSGGAVAQLLLARHPERVRSLLLTNCDTEVESPPEALLPVIELSKQGRFADEWLAPWLADPVAARAPDGIGGMCYADPSHPTDDAVAGYFAPLLADAARKALTHRYAIALERNALTEVGPVLKRDRTPVRTVWGTDDRIFSAASADHLEHAFGGSRGVRRVPGLKLFWPEERPDLVAEEARRLWGVA